jgi:H+/Cl- antiporter ClcA
MTIQIYIAILLTLIVVAIGVLTAVVVVALTQVRRTAQALEVLAGRLDAQLSRLQNVAGLVSNLAGAATGRAGRFAGAAATFLFGVMSALRRRRKADGDADDLDDGKDI